MDSGLLDGESVLGILVALVLLHVLSDVKSLLDQVVKVLGDLGSKSLFSEDSLDLLSSQESDLWN